MEIILFLAKILVVLLSLSVLVFPFAAKFYGFYLDKKNNCCHKRLGLLIYTVLYFVVVTVILCAFKNSLFSARNHFAIKWLVKAVSLPSKTGYAGSVFSVIYTNVAIGMYALLFGAFVKRFLRKKEAEASEQIKETIWKKFSAFENKTVAFLKTETWFFVGKILKIFNIVLSSAYCLIFLLFLLPAIFSAKWGSYSIIYILFNGGYLYPTVTLLALWEIFLFLEGIRVYENAQPETSEDGESVTQTGVSLDALDAELKKQFKDFYVCDVDLSKTLCAEVTRSAHNSITENICRAALNDSRNQTSGNEVYLNCIDKLTENKSLLINGSLFSGLSPYFLRYLSIIIARGDNVVFVCNSALEIEDVYNYLQDGLSQLSSLYCQNFTGETINFDNPIWKIVKICSERQSVDSALIDDASILVTTLDYMCSKEFETEHTRFIHLLDTVVFVNTSETVNIYNHQLAMLNTSLKHITKTNAMLSKQSRFNPEFAIRYMAKEVRYICFDDTRSPGLDKVLKNMLSVTFDSVDAMQYNAGTLVRCYNYECGKNEDGQRNCAQFLNTDEKIDVAMNMALFCLANGADTVDVFAEGDFPFANISESIDSNRAQFTVNTSTGNIRVNKHCYSANGYQVIIVIDTEDNLPVAIRRYLSMVGEKPALLIVFSKPYVMRDYYSANISSIWRSHQLVRTPVEEGTKKDILQRIAVKANAGGISESEILRLAASVPQFEEYVAKRDTNAVLRAVLEFYGLPQEDRINIYKYFEYVSYHDFDENGNYLHEDRVLLRQKGKLYDLLGGFDDAVLVYNECEIPLNLPRRRITQHYIAGQNLIYEGVVYVIQKIDSVAGKIYVKQAVGGKNEEVYQYLQKREYHIEFPENSESCVSLSKHVLLNKSEGDLSVNDIYVSVLRAPMEVLTKGYYSIDSQTPVINASNCDYTVINDPGDDALAKQSYRKYGVLSNPTYSSEVLMKETCFVAGQKNALMMTIRICGNFGENSNRIAALGSVMLNEVLHDMFPSVAEEVVVFPVIYDSFYSEDAKTALEMQSTLKIDGNCCLLPAGDLEFLIVEDSDTDLGVISALMSSGDDIIRTLFAPVSAYLSWYVLADEKSDALYGGLDHEPDCFDFSGLSNLSKLLGDSGQNVHFVDIESVAEYFECDFCGRRFKKTDGIFELEDGRKMCSSCSAKIVGDDKKQLAELLSQATMFLESTYGVTLNHDYDIRFESTTKIVNALKQNAQIARRNFDIPLTSFVDVNRVIHIENSIPAISISELIIRELTYAWQCKYASDVSDVLKEGQIALVAIQYLRFLKENARANARTLYYESTENVSGDGYRQVAKALLDNPQYYNNPFLLLIHQVKNTVGLPTDDVKRKGADDLGKNYTPTVSDRVPPEKVPYFYYARLNDRLKAAYDVLLSAICEHTEMVTIDGYTFDQLCTVSRSISFDRPELFWYNRLSVCGNEVMLHYGATKEDAEAIARRIDEAVPKFLEGIEDSMSAYDAALRVHNNLMQFVDYDTVALNEENKEDNFDGKIDYLRTICGVFLNGRAVCAGYAHAATYLLRKCGIESACAVGHIRKDSGKTDDMHAWNILKIDGEYYYMDATWDDRSNTIQTVKRTDTGFDYFCITTEELERTRETDMCPVEMPLCTAVKANYYVHNQLLFETYDLSKITDIAKRAAQNNERSFTFKCKTQELYDYALERLILSGKDCFAVLKSVSKVNKKVMDSKYSYMFDNHIRTITVTFKYKNL